MSILTYFALLISILLYADADRFRCDYSYFPGGEGWFKLHPPSTWSMAAYTCKVEGAKLAWPLTDGIKDAMLSLIMNDEKTTAVHTGLHYTANVNKTDGEREVYALNYQGLLKIVNQNILLPFICYKNAGESVELNECGTVDNEYFLDNRTGNCYKFHRSHSSWYEALLTCAMEEGSLAIINSETEAEVIRNLFSKNPPETIPGIDWKDNAFLGYWMVEFGGTWHTFLGQTLKEAGYEDFSPGEPNNAGGDEFCGSVGRNGKLFDDPCSRKLPFICERKRKRSCDVIVDKSDSNKFSTSTEKTGKRREHKYDFNNVL